MLNSHSFEKPLAPIHSACSLTFCHAWLSPLRDFYVNLGLGIVCAYVLDVYSTHLWHCTGQNNFESFTAFVSNLQWSYTWTAVVMRIKVRGPLILIIRNKCYRSVCILRGFQPSAVLLLYSCLVDTSPVLPEWVTSHWRLGTQTPLCPYIQGRRAVLSVRISVPCFTNLPTYKGSSYAYDLERMCLTTYTCSKISKSFDGMIF